MQTLTLDKNAMIESHSIPDGDIRQQVLDPHRSFIVQAPAGSGKTALLIQRYLLLLARVRAPEEIIAITFTRKAAGEMRNRVLAALLRAEDSTPPTAPHDRVTWRLAREAREVDRGAVWRLVDNPSRLRIQTIDSLCAALARQLPLLSGFGAAPRVAENAETLYQEAARRTLALLEGESPWSEALETLLRHLDNRMDRLEDLLRRMLARRDQWLRHIADDSDLRLQREHLEAALERLLQDELSALAREFPSEFGSELADLADFAATNLAASGAESPIRHLAGLTRIPGRNLEDLPRWRGLATLLLTQAGGWRKCGTEGIGFPPPSKSGHQEEKQRLKAMKDHFAALLVQLEFRRDLGERLHVVIGFPPTRYRDDQWRVLRALIEVLKLAAAQLYLTFQAQGCVDFTQQAAGALQALGASEAPTDLALILDYRIRHLLVDEFQDTSQHQYELLERLTAGWEPEDGRTLFLVGDPMQSIYRFREAEVGLFIKARREGIGSVSLTPLTLSVNFRSQDGIVNWVNEAFAQALPPLEDIGAGAVPYVASVAHCPPLAGEPVCMHPQLGHDELAEAHRVVQLIRDARRADPDGTIAILVRNRRHLNAIAPQLRRAGYHYRAIEIEALGERPAIQDLRALTRALSHPADRIAWLALLRAPWCGLTLEDLCLLVGDDGQATVWELMSDDSRIGRLSADGQIRLRRLAGELARSLAARQRRTLRGWIEGTWLALGGPACGDVADLVDVEMYFQLLEQFDQGGMLVDFAGFDDALGRLFAQPDPEADDRLQIMTIHKAKGLEFDTVILPGLGRQPRHRDQDLLMWLERPREHGLGNQSDLLMAPIKGMGADREPIYAYLESFHRQQTDYEEGRLLYVAATRARERLHLLGHVSCGDADGTVQFNPPPKNTLLAKLWPVVQKEFTALAGRAGSGCMREQDDGTVAPAADAYIKRLALDWSRPTPSE